MENTTVKIESVTTCQHGDGLFSLIMHLEDCGVSLNTFIYPDGCNAKNQVEVSIKDMTPALMRELGRAIMDASYKATGEEVRARRVASCS